MSSSRIRWVFTCAAGIWLAGCGDGAPADAPAPTTAAPGPAKPPVNRLPADMVAAVSTTRNSGIVGVHFVLNGIPTVGKALPVDIAIVPHQSLASIVAHFDARDGLALATGDALERQTDPAPEKAIKHQLVLLPSKEGVFMVTAVVETESLEGTISRIYSIPVIVGPSASAPVATPPATPANPPASG
jgi:hypothetical protein